MKCICKYVRKTAITLYSALAIHTQNLHGTSIPCTNVYNNSLLFSFEISFHTFQIYVLYVYICVRVCVLAASLLLYYMRTVPCMWTTNQKLLLPDLASTQTWVSICCYYVATLAVSVIIATLLQSFPLRKHIVNARQDASTPKDPLAKVSPFACFSGWGWLNGCCYLPPFILPHHMYAVYIYEHTSAHSHTHRQSIYLNMSACTAMDEYTWIATKQSCFMKIAILGSLCGIIFNKISN